MDYKISVATSQFCCCNNQISIRSVQFSLSAVSDPMQCNPMGCSTPGFPVHHQLPESAQTHVPSSQWCHPTISSSVVPFSSCLQSFPPLGSFLLSQFFTSDNQSIGVSASALVFVMNIHDWFPLELTDWISFQSKGLSRVISSTTVQKHQLFGTQLSLSSNSHIYGKPQLWLDGPLSAK